MARSHLRRIERRRPRHARVRLHIAADSALRIDDRAFVNREMPGNAHLSGQKHVLLQHGTSRQTRLRANDIVLAHHAVVAHLHQAVDLGAAPHARLAERGAVDRSEALDLDIVLHDRHARLHDLVMRPVGALRKPEAIAAHHHAVLQNHAIADPAILAHRGMRVRRESFADPRAFINHDMRMQHGIAPDLDVLAHRDECADRRAFADPRRFRDRRRSDESPAWAAAADRTVRGRARNRDKGSPKSASECPLTACAAMTALAWVVFSFGAYFGFDRNVMYPGPASSIPRTPRDLRVARRLQ